VRVRKIHRRLRPRPSLVRLQFRTKGIRRSLERFRCEFRFACQTLHNARNVHINRNLAAAKCDRRNRPRRVWPNAGEELQLFVPCWQATSGMRRLRRSVQREGTAVIAEPPPRLEHIGGLSLGERGERWEAREESFGELINARDLRLLRHHLNDED
jgi:hypothetical protein